MQVTESIHALKVPFKLRIGPDKTVDRFVFAYLIFGDPICLIDSGVAGFKRNRRPTSSGLGGRNHRNRQTHQHYCIFHSPV